VKYKAFILLLSGLAYIVGWTAVPHLTETPVQKQCCAKAMAKTAHPECPKEGKEDGRCADCCLSCPMCFTTVISVREELSSPGYIIKRVYPVFQSVYIYEYHADAWKPPNRA
jgi:hypothetical protein